MAYDSRGVLRGAYDSRGVLRGACTKCCHCTRFTSLPESVRCGCGHTPADHIHVHLSQDSTRTLTEVETSPAALSQRPPSPSHFQRKEAPDLGKHM